MKLTAKQAKDFVAKVQQLVDKAKARNEPHYSDVWIGVGLEVCDLVSELNKEISK